MGWAGWLEIAGHFKLESRESLCRESKTVLGNAGEEHDGLVWVFCWLPTPHLEAGYRVARMVSNLLCS